jgi:hypothetical protein
VRALRPKILADDFLCAKTGPITNIHIWASWLSDQPDLAATFQLGLWSDLPLGSPIRRELITNGAFELAFTNAGLSGPLDVLPDSIPPSWYRVETFGDQVVEKSSIGPVAANGPSAPGVQAAAFNRTNGGFGGDWTAIAQTLSINVTQYTGLTLSLDVRVWYHNLVAGGSVTPAFEWPAIVQIDYITTNGVSQIWRHGWYLDPPGDGTRTNDPGTGLIPLFNDQVVPQGVWVANSFNLLNELPQVQTITRIAVGGTGWDFRSDLDNVSIKGALTNSFSPFSQPGDLLWLSYFLPGQYSYTFYPTQFTQPFYDPNLGQVIGSDSQIWQYDFPVQANVAFWQTNGHVYWLSVSAQSQDYFGWKTAATNWNDDAVFGHVDNQWFPLSDWQELLAPFSTRSLDLAFSLITMPFVPTPVITNIVVTNQVTSLATNQVIGLAWTYENGIRYQVLSATNMAAGGTNITWSPCGPEIIGPNHWYWETNTAGLRRFYRVSATDP